MAHPIPPRSHHRHIPDPRLLSDQEYAHNGKDDHLTFDVINRIAGEPFLDLVLEPGDSLFIPRGWYHATATSPDTASLHLTVGVGTETEGWIWSTFITAAIGRSICRPQDYASKAMCRHFVPAIEDLGLVTSLHYASWRETLPWPVLQTRTVRSASDKFWNMWQQITKGTYKRLEEEPWRWRDMTIYMRRALADAANKTEKEALDVLEDLFQERWALHEKRQSQLQRFMRASKATAAAPDLAPHH